MEGYDVTFSFWSPASKGSPAIIRFFQVWSTRLSAAFRFFFSAPVTPKLQIRFSATLRAHHTGGVANSPIHKSCVAPQG